MGKVKIKKQSTIIDMTAMSDVTVLLLTFFMLTSTFLQKEPVQVITPPSVSDKKVPDEKLVQVLVGPDGKVYMNITGARDSSIISSEEFRKEVLEEACNLYAQHYGSMINLSDRQKEEFCKIGTFGVKMDKLSEWLDMRVEERDEFLKGDYGGIPIALTKTNDGQDIQKPNEFQIWLRAIKYVISGKYLDKRDDLAPEKIEEKKKKLPDAFKKEKNEGRFIALKAGQYTPYHYVHVVMDNLQTETLNTFSLMTSLKSEEE